MKTIYIVHGYSDGESEVHEIAYLDRQKAKRVAKELSIRDRRFMGSTHWYAEALELDPEGEI